MAAALSIIIPTHKRAALLAQSLQHVARQTIADQLEVIVVSDGHDAATAELFAKVRSTKSEIRNIVFLEIEKSHQGVARNRGVEQATADTVLFSQDDIFLQPDACEKHLAAHRARKHDARSTESETHSNTEYAHHKKVSDFDSRISNVPPKAVLGFTTWDPALTITPVMRWLEKTGWQFGYPLIDTYRQAFVPAEMQHRFTYTSHISLPTSIARMHPFRADVSLYGWEDIEWGMRLKEAGIPLFYEPAAFAYHHHPLTLEQSLARMETLGESAVQLARLEPRLDRLPKGWKRIAYEAISLLPSMRGRHADAFLQGIKRAEKRNS